MNGNFPVGTKRIVGLVTALVGAGLVFYGVDEATIGPIIESVEVIAGASITLVGLVIHVWGGLVAKGPILKDKE